MRVTDNAGDSPQSVALSGTGTAPAVTLSPTSLAFGSQLLGNSSAAQFVIVTNSGTAPLVISGIAVTGAKSGDFAQTNTCPASLAVNGTCSISVTFSPSAPGSRTAAVQITDNAANSPQSVSLAGTGVTPAPTVTLSPTSLSFGSQLNRTTGTAKTVTLTNSGTAALSISSIAVAGANSGDFAQTNTCPASLAINASCTLSVTFSPSASGSRTASVQVTDNAADSPESVSLSGTGVAPAPTVTLSPASLAFGTQQAATVSTAKTVTLANSGTAALSISSIAVAGTNAGDFAQTNNCPASLAVNANCTISVTFDPTATGSRTASVQVTDNAADSPESVSLDGTGSAPAVSLSPTNLSFGSQVMGSPSSAQSVTLTNNGSAALTISSIALTGANPGDFAQTNTCPASPATLAVNGTCTISVTFNPTALGSRSASVQITDNALDSPESVAVSGTGSNSTISFDKNLGTLAQNVGSTTMGLTTSAPASAQSRVFVFVVWAGSGTLSSVSGGGLTWTVDGQAPGPYNDYRVGIASASAPSGLASGTVITATFSSSVNHGNIAAASFLGIATTSPVDVVANSSQLGVTAWSAPITTVNPNDLVLGASIMDALVNNTPGAHNILIQSFQNPNFYSSLTSEYQVVTSAGTKTVNGTWAGTTAGSIENATIIVAYKSR